MLLDSRASPKLGKYRGTGVLRPSEKELMKFKVINGFWSDAGTPDSLIVANNLVKTKYKLDKQ